MFDLPLVSVFPCTRVCQLKFSVKATAITIQNAFSAIVSSMLAKVMRRILCFAGSSSDPVHRSYVTQLVYIVISTFFPQIDRQDPFPSLHADCEIISHCCDRNFHLFSQNKEPLTQSILLTGLHFSLTVWYR